MESTNQSSLFELAVDHESIEHLTETARWAKFLFRYAGIATIIVLSLYAVLLLVGGVAMAFFR